jgi:uncharacterized DUF497 family protein
VLDFDFIEWDDANERHVAAHDLNRDDVEAVLWSPDPAGGISHSGRRTAAGRTPSGRYIRVVFEVTEVGGVVVLRPVTAYDVDPP